MKKIIALIFGILFTCLYPVMLFVGLRTPPRIEESYWDYKKLRGEEKNIECDKITFYFNREDKLYAISCKLPLEKELMGFRRSDTPEKVIKKMGKPLKDSEITLKPGGVYHTLRSLVYRKNGGYMSFHFSTIGDWTSLDTIYLGGESQKLLKRIRLGMSKEELRKIYGDPDKTYEKKRSAIAPYLFLLSLLCSSFWTVFLIDSLPSRKKRAHKIVLFLLSSFIAGVVLLLFCTISFRVSQYITKEVPRLYVHDFWQEWVNYFLPAIAYFIPPFLFLGGLFTFLEYPPKWKKIWLYAMTVLLCLLFAFFLAIPSEFVYFKLLYVISFWQAMKAAFRESICLILILTFYGLILILWHHLLRSPREKDGEAIALQTDKVD